MVANRFLSFMELKWNLCFRDKKTKIENLWLCVKSLTQRQNRSFHFIERTRTAMKCAKMKNARAKRAKLLFFIVK